MTRSVSIPAEPDRLHVVDVLRGIALVGMFFVHFSMFSSGGNAADRFYQSVVSLLFEERFWAMFAILFGAGFAILLRRSDARGGSFVPNYMRRLVALAVFGFIAHACFGFNVLLGYAAWGLPLLLVRRWSVRALVIAAVISAASWNLYLTARTAYIVTTRGEKAFLSEMGAKAAANQAFRKANEAAQESPNYATVIAARLQHMRWFYAQPFSWLPVNTFTLFLLGLIAVRLGLFDAPEEHRRLIVSLTIFGAASWGLTMWAYATMSDEPPSPFLWGVTLVRLKTAFGLLRTMWLAFVYMGVVLLLVAHSRDWLRRLGAFAWTGRMALTNYMIQIAILDLTFSKYALGLTVTPLVGLVMAVALFVANALLSRWWLARFRYGPLEWLWRSMTYARWQPFRIAAPTPAVREELAASS